MGVSTLICCFRVQAFGRAWKVLAGDSWHSRILINGGSFIFTDKMNNFKYYLMSLAPCLKGFAHTKL
jgi:hypothetical protein